jgi:3-hydroxybutyryl-CoA dehydratase
MTLPNLIRFEEIAVGTSRQHEYQITGQVYDGFMAAFDDRSPVHVDEAHAIERGFEGKVMHGGILSGFLSHFVGMVFPGSASLLLSSDLRFSKPSYADDRILLEATVIHKLDAGNVIQMDVSFTNLTRSCQAARGRVQVMVGKKS